MFCSPVFYKSKELFETIRVKFPDSHIIGCSTSGEILDGEVLDGSISCKVMKMERSNIKSELLVLDEFKDNKHLGYELSARLEKDDLKAVLVISDGLNVDGSALCLGLSENFRNNVKVIGGMAGDGQSFDKTWLVYKGKIIESGVVGVGFYGKNLEVNNSSGGGWEEFGPERIITKSSGNVLFEINDTPALDLYKKYLGDKSSDLPVSGLFYPLQIRKSSSDTNKLVRTLLAIDEKTKSLTFAGSMPEGHYVQLMYANNDKLIQAASEAGANIYHPEIPMNKEQSAIFVVSCVGRRLVLGERVEEEIEAVSEAYSIDLSMIGFYSYGEIGVSTEDKACELHNQSITMMSLTEKEAA